ncbi:complement C1q-like protein 4 [Mercenaria mercenaria]|uniref:complement C1q-like protein 4 n=1 Tax=Mercenaria mercenaria TaxID=6596 RepID=UPI00234F825A|nr:complement C1q-like protein 4 [Mercenaria mercenaria]
MSFNCTLVLCFLFGCTSGLLDGLQEHTIEARFQILTQEINKLQQTVAALQKQVDSQNATQTMPIAFTASLQNTITNMGSHQQIVFDYVITNIGNAYSPSHGHFTAPIRGVYAFFVMITDIPGHSASIQLLKNGQWIGHALANGSSQDGNLYVTSTLPVVVQLQKGDEVWVQNEGSFSTVEELDGGSWSSFSGHLVAAN